MFIETYYDERSRFGCSSGEPALPYPELLGEELSLWKRYLPVSTKLDNVPVWLQDNMPPLVAEEIGKARNTLHLFERIEIWSRAGDPMAVGIVGRRYFSIARWGDAKLTIDQVRRKLRLEQWAARLISLVMVLISLAGTWALVTHYGQFPGFIQTAMYQPDTW